MLPNIERQCRTKVQSMLGIITAVCAAYRYPKFPFTASQVMLWQRKIELEREMNDVLDPSVGGDVVGAMKKEIHRMQLRAGELARIQESLLLDLERSIAKRDTIALKVEGSAFQLCCCDGQVCLQQGHHCP